MNRDLKNILDNSNKDIDNQQLIDYLSNQLSEQDSRTIEESMADDEFINDAVEGLQKMENKQAMQDYVEQLNSDLQKQIAKNKNRKNKRKLKDQPYTYFTILLILILLVISFVIIKKRLDAKNAATTTATIQSLTKTSRT
ncbi:MAG: hypothetical protein ABIN94_14520 [Ferruginibacter sp.]